MRVSMLLGLAQPNAINDGGVVQSVGEHCVFWSQHGLEQPSIGVEARPVKYRVLAIVKGGDSLLEVLKNL